MKNFSKSLALAALALALGFGTAQAEHNSTPAAPTLNSTFVHQAGNDYGTVKTTTNSITGSAAAGSSAYGDRSGVLSFAGSAVLTGGVDSNSLSGLGAVAGTAAVATGDRNTASSASSGANANLTSVNSVDKNTYANNYTVDSVTYKPMVDVTPSSN